MNQDQKEPIQNKKQEPQVIYIKEKQGSKGCFGWGCQFFGVSFPLAILVFFVGIIYLLSQKPVGLWRPTVDYLNGDVEIRKFDGKTYDSATREIESQIKTVGPNEIFIDEDQLTALARKNFTKLPDLVADIDDGNVHLYWVANDKIEDKPLIGVATLEPQGDKLVLTRIGTSRIALPSSASQKLVDNFLSVSNFGSSSFDSQDILSELISDEDLNIAELDVQEDRLRLLIDVDVSPF